MKLVVGLGNPGLKYETTRHNAGFLAVDRLIDRWRASGPSQRGEAEVHEASFAGEKVLLIKPQTFMNLSGKAVAPLFQFFKCTPDDVVVLHDEVDLKSMQLRVKTGGGTAGHNGLKSLDSSLGAAQTSYHRVRIGVGRPELGSPLTTADYVLGQFTDAELKLLDPLLDRVSDATEMLLKGEALRAMTEFNR